MFGKHLINQILITLHTGEKNGLFILLDKNGTIHRKGNGNADADLPLLQGRSTLGHFDALLMTVNENIFHHTGVIKMPNRVGEECTLTIIFQAGEIDYSFRVVYGQQSEGPPQELTEILINAVKLTQGWYDENQASLKQEETGKSSWKFWK